MKLSDIAEYVSERISSSDIELSDYVTTDSLLQNKCGRDMAQNLPPAPCSLTLYREGDVLIANIRPYLKKIWRADQCGGASADVLVLRAKDGVPSEFLYAVCMQDAFYQHTMNGAKGTKMPRGDKNQIMRFPINPISPTMQKSIGEIVCSMESKITINRQINHNLEAIARQLYDYWFVQFDFPNAEGKPYKSSGGEMVFNEKIKREIPKGWIAKPLFEAANVQYGYPFSTDSFSETETNVPVIRIRDILSGTISAYTTECPEDKYRINTGDILIGMDGNFHMNYWHRDTDYLNQRCVMIRPHASDKVSSIQIFLQLRPYIKAKEKSIIGSTVGHLLDKDIRNLHLYVPGEDGVPFPHRQVFDYLLTEMLNLRIEIEDLTKQRDELLPLLMNGQATVNYDLSHD